MKKTQKGNKNNDYTGWHSGDKKIIEKIIKSIAVKRTEFSRSSLIYCAWEASQSSLKC